MLMAVLVFCSVFLLATLVLVAIGIGSGRGVETCNGQAECRLASA